MVRFEVGAADAASKVRRARDTRTGQMVVLERGARSDRLRQLQAIPSCAAIAPFERTRDDHRLQLVHPAPLELASPVDEFDVAQAIGSMLDGLAWLHLHGVAHGSVGPLALTPGPTGGRLSLAGAFSASTATPQDDVYAASVLARRMLVGAAAVSEVADDVLLEQYASPAVAQAIRAGLDPDAAQRPSALRLAAMVRGEFLSPVSVVDIREPLLVRLRASVLQMSHTFGGAAAGIGAAVAAVILIASLAAADQHDPPPVAQPSSLAEEPAAEVLSLRVERAPETTTTVAPTTTVAAAPDTSAPAVRSDAPALVVAPPSTSAPANDPAPPPTIAAPPPPSTTVAPKPVAPTTPTTAPAPTTKRVSPTTTTPAPTTTAPPKGKKPKEGKGGLAALLDELLS